MKQGIHDVDVRNAMSRPRISGRQQSWIMLGVSGRIYLQMESAIWRVRLYAEARDLKFISHFLASIRFDSLPKSLPVDTELKTETADAP